MTVPGGLQFPPVAAAELPKEGRSRGLTALTALTVYVLLLCLIPSNLAIEPLGSLGRPAVLWGLVLGLWWVIHHLHAPAHTSPSPWQPVRLAFAALVVVALISFALALLRGQPSDQISPAATALVRLASWGGVLFVAMDGIQTMGELRSLLKRFVLVVTLVAVLGLVQTLTGQPLVDQLSIPGFVINEEGGTQSRGSLTRAAGTATHPLEFAMLLTLALPLALTSATVQSERAPKRSVGPWLYTAVIAMAVLVSASRSALLGFAAAIVLTLPGLHSRLRGYLIVGSVLLAAAAVIATPGLFSTMLRMFTGVSSDPSAMSRSGGLERAPGFIEVSPLVGVGLGTFLPRYYIFDNQWILLAVELGILGLIASLSLVVAASWSAWSARSFSSEPDARTLGQGLLAACITGAVLLAGFDGLAFPISSGALFLIIGLSAAIRSVASADRWMYDVRHKPQAGT